MPIKELIALASAAVVAIAVSGGPQNLTRNLRRIEVKMLREASRTDNWGTPYRWERSVRHSNLKKYPR